MEIFTTFFPYDATVTIFGLVSIIGSFVFFGLFELLRPARRGMAGRDRRMTVNFGLGIFNMALSAILPISSLAMAMLAASKDWGLFQIWPVDWFIALPVLLLAKSLMGYATHRAFHEISWLWPLHALHHRDDAVDLSTSFRSHPVAHLIVLLPHALLSFALGPEIWVVLIAEAILLSCALFHHANVQLPENINRRLESWLVTPRMHLVHHARERHLHDSNYGEIFSFWDHLFGTYRAHPDGVMEIGVEKPAKSFWRLQ
jgi:sterol desaturase/sphingolipid hydroxylase (fatty acid hydroxylase superfamily)